MNEKDIKNFALEELEKEMVGLSEPPYRAGQVFSWLYQRGASDFSQVSDIPQKLRQKLNNSYFISRLELVERLEAKDKTQKFLFKLADKNFIETVLIPSGQRKTVCLSTQVGCKYRCSFCASGLNGFKRNLSPAEMTGQILYLLHTFKQKLTNYVFMGMGEPLDNFENLSRTIRIMNSPQGLGIAARRITVSTAGVIPGIERLKNLGLQVNLSLSLHAVNDSLRNELMPINRKYPLQKLIRTCQNYVESTGRMITVEYVLIRDVNDSLKDAEKLAAISKRLKAKINLIPYSPVCDLNFKTPQQKGIDNFKKELERNKVKVTLRRSKGEDIQAACGQLAGRAKQG
jgi:23S rRNA (adenine2503-C2)-methyltransferase